MEVGVFVILQQRVKVLMGYVLPSAVLVRNKYVRLRDAIAGLKILQVCDFREPNAFHGTNEVFTHDCPRVDTSAYEEALDDFGSHPDDFM